MPMLTVLQLPQGGCSSLRVLPVVALALPLFWHRLLVPMLFLKSTHMLQPPRGGQGSRPPVLSPQVRHCLCHAVSVTTVAKNRG